LKIKVVLSFSGRANSHTFGHSYGIYAGGGELFERICNAGRFSEDEVYQLYYMGVFHIA